MKTFLRLILTLVALFPIIGSAEVRNPATTIIEAIKTGQVDRVKIWLTDVDAIRHAALTPGQLEKSGELIAIRDFKNHKATPLLLRILQDFESPVSAGSEDYRIGIKFFNSEGTAIHSLYFAAPLGDVLCDGQGAEIRGALAHIDLREWIKQIQSELKHP